MPEKQFLNSSTHLTRTNTHRHSRQSFDHQISTKTFFVYYDLLFPESSSKGAYVRLDDQMMNFSLKRVILQSRRYKQINSGIPIFMPDVSEKSIKISRST